MDTYTYLYVCKVCAHGYTLGRETTLFVYATEPSLNHVVTSCSVCYKERTFWNLDEDTVAGLMLNNTPPHNPIAIEWLETADAKTRYEFAQSREEVQP